ncbi:MAG TPA: hypothetical protein VF957_23430 [Bradyrhizobium sp.]
MFPNPNSAPLLIVDTMTLPACWAAALVNNDYSGLDATDATACRNIVSGLASQGFRVVDVARDDNGEGADPRFTWSYDTYGGTARGGDVLDYVVHCLG